MIISKNNSRAFHSLSPSFEKSLENIAMSHPSRVRINNYLSGSICRVQWSILTTLGRRRPWNLSSSYPTSLLSAITNSNHMFQSLVRERVSATRRTSDDARHTESSPASRRPLGREATRRRQASASVLSHALVTNHDHDEEDDDDDDDEVGTRPTVSAPAFQQFAERTRCFAGNYRKLQGPDLAKNCW